MPASQLPIKPVRMLIPKPQYQNQNWPVVACDQYTSEPQYWEKRAEEVAEEPSTLNLVLPEYILEEKGAENCAPETEKIWQTMERYIADGVFTELEEGFVLCSRLLPDGKTWRNGVVLAIDLDAYLHIEVGEPAIRASEETVENRLPARIAVREGASLELPHVLSLIDDPACLAVEGLVESLRGGSEPLYDIELPEKAGRVKSYFIPATSEAAQTFISALKQLPSFVDHGLFSYVGDGNHSLAAAKRIREKERKNGQTQTDSPARYALVELINVHDPGLIFHPIHQLIYDTAPEEALNFSKDIFQNEGVEISEVMDFDLAYKHFMAEQAEQENAQIMLIRQGREAYLLRLKHAQDYLPISAAHRLTGGMQEKYGKRIDYIHGEKSLEDLSQKEHLALYLPNLQKTAFFPALEKLNVLPKKTFSLGEAAEKRHYIEARYIK